MTKMRSKSDKPKRKTRYNHDGPMNYINKIELNVVGVETDICVNEMDMKLENLNIFVDHTKETLDSIKVALVIDKDGWTKVNMIVDSDAYGTIIHPRCPLDYPLDEIDDSQIDTTFSTVNDDLVSNLGE